MFGKRRSKMFHHREYWIAGLSAAMGASLGVGFTYFCDPDRGHARRRQVADRASSLIAQGEHLLEHKSRNILNRAEGMLAQARSRFQHVEAVTDDVLQERVRSRLGHLVEHPYSICTAVQGGVVSLTGTVAAEKKKLVLREVRSVAGVLKVKELLTSESRRNARSIPRLLGGIAGAAAVFLALASRRPHIASRHAAA